MLLRSTFLKQQRGFFFFHYYDGGQHKIDIVTVTEANKNCADISSIDALTSVYVLLYIKTCCYETKINLQTCWRKPDVELMWTHMRTCLTHAWNWSVLLWFEPQTWGRFLFFCLFVFSVNWTVYLISHDFHSGDSELQQHWLTMSSTYSVIMRQWLWPHGACFWCVLAIREKKTID